MEMTTGTPRRALRRSRTDRMLTGVAGGIADYAGVDPTLVRLGFVLLTVFGGSGALIYLVALVIMPSADGESILDGWRRRR
jgi:phage shock protein PspC (stress-responsive transcriptional regulator)